jgi:hypothetical protein
VASLGAPFAGLKAAKTESGDINFVVNTLAYGNNGSAYNPSLASKAKSLGQLYSSNFVRHWVQAPYRSHLSGANIVTELLRSSGTVLRLCRFLEWFQRQLLVRWPDEESAFGHELHCDPS